MFGPLDRIKSVSNTVEGVNILKYKTVYVHCTYMKHQVKVLFNSR